MSIPMICLIGIEDTNINPVFVFHNYLKKKNNDHNTKNQQLNCLYNARIFSVMLSFIVIKQKVIYKIFPLLNKLNDIPHNEYEQTIIYAFVYV